MSIQEVKALGIDERIAECAEDGWEFVIVTWSGEKVSLKAKALKSVALMTDRDWLSALSKAEADYIDNRIVDTVIEAAESAGVDPEDIDENVLRECCLDFAEDIIEAAKEAIKNI